VGTAHRMTEEMTQEGHGMPRPCLFKPGWHDMMRRCFECLENMVSWINKLFVFFACLMMSALVVIVCIDLALRYFYNAPLLWGTEVTEILLLDITFLGAAWVFKEDGHVAIDLFTAKTYGRTKKVLSILSLFCVGVVAAVLVYYGFYTTYDHYVRKVFNPTVLETPIALIIVIIPLGSAPLLLEVLIKGWKLLKQR
jgi:TRAP-type C4-dicarboxylate transport system permease small subunit